MTIGFAMLAATIMIAVIAAIISACYVVVSVLFDHPIALAAVVTFMMWLFAVALIYNAGGAS